MDNLFFIIVFLFFSLGMKAQKIFKVIEVDRNDIYDLKGTSKKTKGYFRIVSNSDTARINATYPLLFSKDIDTLKAIGELLKYEGDTRICALPIYSYSAEKSQIYAGRDTDYSIQVEALFIINQLVYVKIFNYASYPILLDKRNGKTYSIGSTMISMAFRAYKKWYQLLKEKGNAYVKDKSFMPLDGSSIRWY